MSINLTPEEKQYIQKYTSYLEKRSCKVNVRLWILIGISVFFIVLSFLSRTLMPPAEKSWILDAYFMVNAFQWLGIVLLGFLIANGRNLILRQRIFAKIIREKLDEEENKDFAVENKKESRQ